MAYFWKHAFNWYRQDYEVHELYVSLSVRSLGMGVGGVFAPIYLLELGYSLAAVATFFLAAALVRLPLEILNGYAIARFGAKHILSLSYLAAIGYFLALYSIPLSSIWLPIAALLLGAEMSWFWSGYHAHFGQSRSHGSGGRQGGVIIVARRMMMTIGPLLGGIVATAVGIEYSLLLAAGLLTVSVYPLLQTPDYYGRHTFRFRWIKSFHLTVANIGYQADMLASLLLWPAFMFLLLGAYDNVGFVLSLSGLVVSFLSVYSGKLVDSGRKNLLLVWGSVLGAAANAVRIFTATIPQFLLVNFSSDISSNMLAVPFNESLYQEADQSERLNFVVNVQLRATAAKALLFGSLWVFAVWLPPLLALQTVFGLAAAVSLLIPLVAAQK